MKLYVFPILLQILGFLVVVAEVFIPSMGVLAVIAVGVISYSLYLFHTMISVTAFWFFLAGDLLVLPLVLVLGLKALARSPLTLKKELSSREGVVSHSPDLAAYLDKRGKTLSTLRPSGTALIEGKRLDVVADGDYIEAGAQVQVSRVAGNQIVVNRIDSES